MGHLVGLFVVLTILGCTVHLSVSRPETTVEFCEKAFVNVSFRSCCDVPRLWADETIEWCRGRPLPPVPPGVPEPILENCVAECALNATQVLVDHRFRVEQARKVLLERTANDTAWVRTIGIAIDKCYRSQVANVFYLQDVAQNRISSQCLPSWIKFLECTFSIAYRDCPNEYWNYSDETCFSLVLKLNTCRFLFRGTLKV